MRLRKPCIHDRYERHGFDADYRVYLCGGEDLAPFLNPLEPPLVTKCSDHAAHPEGYVDWHHWARTLGKTHRQERCDECGLFAIWRSRNRNQVGESE